MATAAASLGAIQAPLPPAEAPVTSVRAETGPVSTATQAEAEKPVAEDTSRGRGFWGSRARANLLWAGKSAFSAAEFVGEIVADMLGLNQSQYQWVIDSIEDDKQRAEVQRKIEERRRGDAGQEQAARDAAADEASNANTV